MNTAISNPYMMQAAPKERTPITFLQGHRQVYCHGCGRRTYPRIICTKHLSKPLAVCGHCRSVIQYAPRPKDEKKQAEEA